jgi:hypothetical protein
LPAWHEVEARVRDEHRPARWHAGAHVGHQRPKRARVGGVRANAVADAAGHRRQRRLVHDAADLALDAVGGDERQQPAEDDPRRAGARRGRAREHHRQCDRQRHKMELVGSREQVAEPHERERRERPAAPAAHEPRDAAEHQDQRHPELEQLVRVEPDVRREREWQPLQSLLVDEADRLVQHVAAAGDQERHERHRRHDER